jgi:rfaE bifunctional protein nucleotidyltransferase chain/domain
MTADKIFSLSELLEKCQYWRGEGQKTVFTNGCFDILHLGHIDYLEKAKSLGNKLIVGVNADFSVKRLKGETRPINNEYARCRMLAALDFVDAVVLFGEDTPLHLITTLLPDILVKGNDYNISNIIGADIVMANGGEVKTIELVVGYSTTNLIKKMKS